MFGFGAVDIDKTSKEIVAALLTIAASNATSYTDIDNI